MIGSPSVPGGGARCEPQPRRSNRKHKWWLEDHIRELLRQPRVREDDPEPCDPHDRAPEGDW